MYACTRCLVSLHWNDHNRRMMLSTVVPPSNGPISLDGEANLIVCTTYDSVARPGACLVVIVLLYSNRENWLTRSMTQI